VGENKAGRDKRYPFKTAKGQAGPNDGDRTRCPKCNDPFSNRLALAKHLSATGWNRCRKQ
jgi:hypothetical protein